MELNKTYTDAVCVVVDSTNRLLKSKNNILIAIDGRSASGKSTFAHMLSEKTSALVLHMDDFFLRPEQRNDERLRIPGGNVDRERFLTEVLIPLSKGDDFLYRPYNCHLGRFGESQWLSPCNITIVEGSYSCHPEMFDFYDLHIFLDVDRDTQQQRILLREGEVKAEVFKNKWIPLEEKYFSYFNIQNKCEHIFNNL